MSVDYDKIQQELWATIERRERIYTTVTAGTQIIWSEGKCGMCGNRCNPPVIDRFSDGSNRGGPTSVLFKSQCEQCCRYISRQTYQGEALYTVTQKDTPKPPCSIGDIEITSWDAGTTKYTYTCPCGQSFVTIGANQNTLSHNVAVWRKQHEDTRRKESKMDRMSVIDGELERLAAERARLAALPKEPEEDDAVVWFQKSFGSEDEDRVFTYVAGKMGDGKWWVTGSMNRVGPYDWDGLLKFVGQGETAPIPLYRASGWDDLGDV